MQGSVMEKNEFSVLVVDDSDFSRRHLTKIVTDLGYKLAGEASSAKEAIAIIPRQKPNVCIIDIVMPEISGLELAETVSQNFKNIKIIMISSLSQENIIIESISAGATVFIQKPISQQQLHNSLEKIRENIS
jgi:YesN/AraC family two-component response regulator